MALALLAVACLVAVAGNIAALVYIAQQHRRARRLPHTEWRVRHRVRMLCRQSYPTPKRGEWTGI